MRIVINNTTYTKIKGLSFSQAADIIGDSLPISEFEANIITDDDIAYGQWAVLYDDAGYPWVKYWVVYAEHEIRGVIHIRAQSEVFFLEHRKLPAAMYTDMSVVAILDTIFWGIPYSIDESAEDKLYDGGEPIGITGYCPEQTARERLLWICLKTQCYVKSGFGVAISIAALVSSTKSIPVNKTFWKPIVSYKDYVTAIKVTGYTYTEGTPGSTDTWVTDGTHYYIQTEQVITLTNSNAPVSAPENVVEITGVTIVSPSDAARIATFVSDYYFNRTECDMDVINNREYAPGDRIVGFSDEQSMFSGYISSADYRFGLQARATLHIMRVMDADGANLIILYKYGGKQLDRAVFYLPAGYAYTISNPWFDLTESIHRYVYNPQNENATGVVESGGSTNTQQYNLALDMNFSNGILSIYSVDELDEVEETEDGQTIDIVEIA